jgi:hypothetical protein
LILSTALSTTISVSFGGSVALDCPAQAPRITTAGAAIRSETISFRIRGFSRGNARPADERLTGRDEVWTLS